ncbi:dTMP kinase [Dokdonella immobilis]|uniref:Thymidylate kinase n=1 Tax=Dokdonella immobilis TaxID=578942 RepID=A0A1I4VWG6_9GAMM|nr:dTMP kinase [Dokdonella immobilis]SFN05356.1 thymidylate kinase [Dokdonella immobilis]
MKGRLITLEGGEGAGKSTVLQTLREHIESSGIRLQVTREPGGTALGEAIRAIVLDPELGTVCAESELLLMFAARAQLVRELIRPALERGEWVLADRFTDASFAYQGGGRGQPGARIEDLEVWAAEGLRPDLTILLDLPVSLGLARAGERGRPDRIEAERGEFFERVREAYRRRADADPHRFRVIDASRPLPRVTADAIAAVDALVADWKP